MITSTEILKKLLLSGKRINKFDFLSNTMANGIPTVCLAQRVLDLKEEGWNISRKVIKGKGTLHEYWLEQEEINRLTANGNR